MDEVYTQMTNLEDERSVSATDMMYNSVVRMAVWQIKSNNSTSTKNIKKENFILERSGKFANSPWGRKWHKSIKNMWSYKWKIRGVRNFKQRS